MDNFKLLSFQIHIYRPFHGQKIRKLNARGAHICEYVVIYSLSTDLILETQVVHPAGHGQVVIIMKCVRSISNYCHSQFTSKGPPMAKGQEN